MQAKMSGDSSYLFFSFKIIIWNLLEANESNTGNDKDILFFCLAAQYAAYLEVIFILLQYATTINDPSFQDFS